MLRQEVGQQSLHVYNAISTIQYLYNARAKIILLSNWSMKNNSELLTAESVAGKRFLPAFGCPVHMIFEIIRPLWI